MPTIRKRQDWALFLTIMQKCKIAHGMVEPLAHYRKTPEGISRKKFRLINYDAKVYQHVFGYSPIMSYAYLMLIFMPTYLTKRAITWIANIRR